MDEKKDEITFSQEDIDSINKDIEEAKTKLSTDTPAKENKPGVDVASLTESIKAQIMADMKADEEAKAEAAKTVNLEQELARQKQLAKDQLDALTAKMDQLQASKGVVSVKSPFEGDKVSYEEIINDQEKMKAIDDASRKTFFEERG